MELKQRTRNFSAWRGLLLIVPYGIETSVVLSNVMCSCSFNRTLWN